MDRYDLTSGAVWKRLLAFFFPIALGTWFQQLYNAVDGVIVGKYVGTQALAAVGGSAHMVVNVLINMMVSLTSGAAVIISHYYGAKKQKEVREAVGTGVLFCVALGLLLTGILIWLTPAMLRLMQTPEETMEDAVLYVRIYFTATLPVFLLNMESGILRACGDAVNPVIILAVGVCGFRILWIFTLFRKYHTLFCISMAYPASWIITSLILVVYYIIRRKEGRLYPNPVGTEQ